MIDLRVKIQGVRVRLVGFGNRKLAHIRILQVGLARMKARLAAGLDSEDAKTAPLSKGYAIRKSKLLRKAAKRDLRLTGSFLDTFLPRYADDQRAAAYASGRLGRAKAILYRNLINFSPTDMRAMSDAAGKLMKDEFQQVFQPLTRGASGRSRFQRGTRFQQTAFARAA